MAKSKSPKPTTSSDYVPDWSYWGNLAITNLRSALQLSLGLDPNKHTPALEQKAELRERYWNRLTVAKNHAPEADWVVGRVVREDGDISLEFTEVYLKKFAAWIINETSLRPLSDEFERLGSSVVGVSPTLANTKKDWTQRPAKDFVEEKSKAGSYRAAGELHGVSRQRYTDRYKEVVGGSTNTKPLRKGLPF